MVKDIKDGYIEFDPFEKGNVETTNEYTQKGVVELTRDGTMKDFDGWKVGDFFKLSGEFEVARSNEIFTKVKIGDKLISIPNHKIWEVK